MAPRFCYGHCQAGIDLVIAIEIKRSTCMHSGIKLDELTLITDSNLPNLDGPNVIFVAAIECMHIM